MLTYADLEGLTREMFFQDLLHTKHHGMPNQQDPYSEKVDTDLLWIGDKKPAQTTDPSMRPWVKEHFPDAKNLHLGSQSYYVHKLYDSLEWADGDVDFLH